ncbi:MAG TPA: glutamate 5-kinase, partial [bacterium]|nr:glutamate 5-kinase [bacterium]
MSRSQASPKDRVEQLLKTTERIVVKVGTNLIDGQKGFNLPMLAGLASDLADLRSQGKQVILVTSGAVGAGRRLIGTIQGYPKSMPERQACAALGQAQLMHLYQELFQHYGCRVAQVLLTEDAVTDRERYVNARNTLEKLLEWGVIPIINENDTVATDELKFGDNDRLSALVASKVHAQLLILLTDVDGLYDQPPQTGKGTLIEYVEHLSPEIESAAGHKGSNYSIGGMKAKIVAVEISMRSGILAAIANGNRFGIVHTILQGEGPATWFLPSGKPLSSKKAWLATSKRVCEGKILVDQGAQDALLGKGKSLLPIGVIQIKGRFKSGDTVSICDSKGKELARGLVNFSQDELILIAG